MDFSQFWSDFLATVLGVALALIGAIALEKYTRSKKEISRLLEKRSRARLVLSLIKKELDYNLAALAKIDDNIYSTYNFLRTESWKAFSDGGEIKWIDDPELLDTISTAYSNLFQFISLYEKLFQSKFFINSGTYNDIGRVLTNYTLKARNDSIELIKAAIAKIEKKLPHESQV